jgi:hypothetical protein
LDVSLSALSEHSGSMKATLPDNPSGFDTPAAYRIVVRGRIPVRWRDRLDGMTIVEDSAKAEIPVTTLEGDLSDQAALSGVLRTLYELHLAVLSVERLS